MYDGGGRRSPVGCDDETGEHVRTDLQISLKRSGIDLWQLNGLQRILLTTDGTVTDVLEAHYREPMEISVLRQERLPLTDLDEHVRARLELAREDTSDGWDREVLLHGQISGSCMLYARSVVLVERLNESMRVGLLEKQRAIGHLLLEQRALTFKEIIECRREPAGALAKHFQIREDAPLLMRGYIVSVDRGPMMLIREKFPEWGR
jgi:chorismate-pyruvate lyase